MSTAGLPGSLFDTYAFYKKSTTTIIQWLSAHSSRTKARNHIDSTRDLIYLTEAVVKNQIKVPNDILQILRKTIRARTRVGKFFKKLAASKEDDAASSHEFFTSVLQRVYNDLRGLAEEEPETPTTPECDQCRLSNAFEHLHTESCPEDCLDEYLEREEDGTHEGSEKHSRGIYQQSKRMTRRIRSRMESNVENDYVNDFLTLSTYLLELDRLGTVMKQNWKSLAAGAIPSVVAATTANIAYQIARELEKGLHEYGIHDPDDFSSRYSLCVDSLNLRSQSSMSDKPQLRPDFTLSSDEKGPRQGWLALKEFRESWHRDKPLAKLKQLRKGQSPRSVIAVDDPAKFFAVLSGKATQGENEELGDRPCLDLLLKRMGQLLILSHAEPSSYIPFHTPLLDELADFLGIEEKPSDKGGFLGHPRVTAMESRPLSLSFGLQMLAESYKSFGLPTKKDIDDGQKTTPCEVRRTCRVQSLQFAADVGFQLEHLLATKNPPCMCLRIGTYTVARLLAISRVVLHRFVNTIRFDIYYQAPWTSCQHMAEHLSAASDMGAKAWHHAYYVGTTLYIYHCLVLLNVIHRGQAPVLERLCDLFEDSVFLGQRPRRNLYSCYKRWAGGSLDLTQGNCSAIHNHQGKWGMKFEKDASQGGNHPIRGFNPSKISLFSLLAGSNFILDDNVLAWVYCSKTLHKESSVTSLKYGKNPANRSQTTSKDVQEAREKLATEPSKARIVELVQEQVLEDFQGDFPVATINYFKIYEICVDILAEINRVEHADTSRDPYSICSCISERLLSGTDEYVDNPYLVKTFRHRGLLENCKECILKIAGDTPLSDFQLKL